MRRKDCERFALERQQAEAGAFSLQITSSMGICIHAELLKNRKFRMNVSRLNSREAQKPCVLDKKLLVDGKEEP